MKRKIFWILMGTILCTISGCAQNAASEQNEITQLVVTEQIEGSDLKLSEVTDFSGELDFQYNSETDAQSNIGQIVRCAYSPQGKYTGYQNEAGQTFLYFEDNSSGQEVLVCNKSNCKHEDEECNAFFDNEIYSGFEIWYYEENLYTIALYDEYLWLEKISLDGAVREKGIKIVKMASDLSTDAEGNQSVQYYYPEMKLHRGYVYYSDGYPGSSKSSLWRIPIGGSENARQIFSVEGSNVQVYRVYPFGRYVFFQAGCMGDAEGNIDISLYAYDTECNDSVYLMKDNAVREYTVRDNCLYYSDLQDDIYQLNLETGEEELFFETTSCPEFGEENSVDGLFWNGENMILRIYGNAEFQIVVDKEREYLVLTGADMVEYY